MMHIQFEFCGFQIEFGIGHLTDIHQGYFSGTEIMCYCEETLINPEGFKGLSWLIMCGGVVCVKHNINKGGFSFWQIFLNYCCW